MEKSTENIIHVCFSASAGAVLKYAVKKEKSIDGKKVIAFPDDISQGIIEDYINADERINWLNSLSEEDERIRSWDNAHLRKGYKKFYKKIQKVKSSDTLYLWFGQCSQELCGMMYTLELIKDKNPKMYFINVSDKIEESLNGNVYTYRAVAEIMPKKLKTFIDIKRKIEAEEFNELLNQWNVLKTENSLLRVYEEGKIKSVKEDYFDIDILKYTEKNLKKSARIVGSILGYSENKISDEYIFWRVQELVKSEMLEFKGKLGVMREMEIKISPKGLEYLSTDPEAILFWKNKEAEIEKELDTINEAKKQGRMEEKISITKKLMDVLDLEVIAEKTGLTIGQVKNLENDERILQ
ncbi:DUF1835 domain-containing protein [Clostridium sp. C2-6-12]|uniref:DUF1835 domain-containing protein n=1 Tax=Clostridium sp. C2-6-12 TaxID=2698832 RepID=UPI00137187B8|nr:DUF1835 domain-containing protein [Clostridium sp. C2-6-12]